MAEWSQSSAMIISQLWSDWEIQLYVLLSFVLQIFLFFIGGLRRRNGHKMLVRFPIWLAYLLADLVAVYALGYLSRHVATTSSKDERQGPTGQTHQLTFFWAPFLLIHLGGQDTVTAFSIEDNELWLRHLLNLLTQTWLALYVFLKSKPSERLAVPAVFVFVAGIIKYGERIWALKSGSENALRSSTVGNEVVKQLFCSEANLQYSRIVKSALCSETGVRDIFAGRRLHQLNEDALSKLTNNLSFEGLEDGEVHFKVVEIELGLIYDELYTKAKVVQKLLGTILRCVSFVSLIAAFVVFVTVVSFSKHGGRSRVDVTITYVLFTGSFCLEICAISSLVISPRTWAFLEGRQYHTLARVVWSASACAGLQTRPWWSNSMGQYNFLSSCIPGKKPSAFSKLITKIVDLVGAKQLWSNIQYSTHAEVKTGLKNTISTFLGDLQPASRVAFRAPPSSLSSCHWFYEIIRYDFTRALLSLHVFTDLFLHKVMPMVTEETRGLMEVCKGISDYMFYLLAVHPAMLPVGSDVKDLLSEAMDGVKKASSASSKEQFLSALADGSETSAFGEAGKLFEEAKGVLLLQEKDLLGAALEEVVSMWVRLLVYAAGKSSPREHARLLSMGGELLTFVWLLMAHRMLGDFGGELDLWARDPAQPVVVRPDVVTIRGFLFEFPTNY